MEAARGSGVGGARVSPLSAASMCVSSSCTSWLALLFIVLLITIVYHVVFVVIVVFVCFMFELVGAPLIVQRVGEGKVEHRRAFAPQELDVPHRPVLKVERRGVQGLLEGQLPGLPQYIAST